MKIILRPQTKEVYLESEDTHDIFMLGKLSAKMRSARHSGCGEKHTLECDQYEFLKLAVDGTGRP